MNKHFVTIAACALAIFGASSCKGTLQEKEVSLDTHSVVFNANLEDNTKTALLIKVVPSWKNTENASVHLYENDKAGDNCTITTGEGGNYEKAKFSATFSGSTAPFCYRGVVASVNDDDKFYIPAIQTPDAESLIDPKADFLVGGNDVEYDTAPETIDLYFSRPVALSRLAITNFEGKNVISVKITSEDELTGEVAYDGINFENRTASFTGGSKELTLSYGEEGVTYSGGTFYAYFVSLPGTMKITNVEVTTDEYIYTKTVGKSTTFTANDFKNIALNLSNADKQEKTNVKTYTKVATNSGSLDAGTYLIVNKANNRALSGTASTNDNTNDITVTPSENVITGDYTANEMTISVSGSNYTIRNASGLSLYCGGNGTTYLGYQQDTQDNFTLETSTTYTDRFYFKTSKSGSATEYLYYNGTNYFKIGSSGKPSNTDKTKEEAAGVYLYLLDGSAKASRNLAFAESSVSKNLGDEAFTNALSGITDGVTFTSTNTDVATVNSATGQVTVSPSNAGTTTITASAPETETYSAAEVSYTLTVIDPDAVAYYTKVTSALPTSGSWDKVLFVYDNGDGTGYAFKGIYDGDASKAPNGKTEANTYYLTETGNAVEVSITSSGIVSTSDIDACTLTLEFTTEKDGTAGKHNLKMNAVNGYFRILESNNTGKSDAGKFVVMSDGGYRMSYSTPSDETNNFTAKRKSYYFSFNGTNFAGTTTPSSFCIYKLDE